MTFGKRRPTGYQGCERRREQRQRTDVFGLIVLPGTEVPCQVVDISSSGARLAVVSSFGLPMTFDLRAFGLRYRASVKRRIPGYLGVAFCE